MNKNTFLQDSNVGEFITWIKSHIDNDKPFYHEFLIRKTKKTWNCSSIHDAYEKYEWAFNFTDYISGNKIKGNSFTKTRDFLINLSAKAKKALQENNSDMLRKSCLNALAWGGVLNRNKEIIDQLHSKKLLIDYFLYSMNFLNVNTFNSENQWEFIHNGINHKYMNAGFTKLYSLLIDDFIIYDGRVGAAMGLFVNKFCREQKLDAIPKDLLFVYGRSRDKYNKTKLDRRDPSHGNYKFPSLNGKKDTDLHILNNMKANWICSRLADETKFNKLDSDLRLLAIESGLFMIGYDIRNSPLFQTLIK